jgi:formate C-acetyltransferase
VDALSAIKKLVYEEKQMSLRELTEVLRANWQGQEVLRRQIKNKYPKYGMGDAGPDALAGDIVKNLAAWISGKPNVKGGKYRLGLFSINWRWEFGKKTAASADGRFAGESLSQNTSASFGADRLGATGHLLSAVQIDSSDTPNGAIIDIDMHSSAVRGSNGLKSLVGTLRSFFAMGGFAVHYNILDNEVLQRARKDPDAYPNLQVRLCGWNVLFSTLTDKEKEEFIERFSK